MKYDIQYFIDKFEAIPAEKWTRGVVYDASNDTYCALGHCGIREAGGRWTKTEEANALENIYRNNQGAQYWHRDIEEEGEIYYFWRVNDRLGKDSTDGSGIKAGVIRWLKEEKERLDALNQT